MNRFKMKIVGLATAVLLSAGALIARAFSLGRHY